jgi:rubredoxin
MKEIQKRIEEITKFTNELRKVLDTQIEQHSLHADKLISDIFALGVLCPSSAELVQTAKLRYDRGNPPGKDRSYGDAINWETLLAVCPDKEDLYFVGGDRDYTSPIKPSAFSSFLRREWEKRKHSSVHYYELISEFIKQKFAQIQITDDQIQEEKRVATEFPPLSGTYGTASVPSISGGLGYLGAFLTKEKLARCPYCGFEFNARKSSSFLDIAAGLKSETWSQQCPNCQRSFFV